MAKKTTKIQRQVKFTNSLSDEVTFFLEPEQPKQRQYETLRAYFVENLAAKDVAARFGYTIGALSLACPTEAWLAIS